MPTNNFVPKKLDDRSQELKKIKAKELQAYNTFLKTLQQNLSKLTLLNKNSNLKLADIDTYFINMLQDCSIKIDHTNQPFNIYFFLEDKYIANYDYITNHFVVSYLELSKFEKTFQLSYQTSCQHIQELTHKYLQLEKKHISIGHTTSFFCKLTEETFKNIPVLAANIQ